MAELEFIWDPQKNNGNKKKHGVSFEEARSAFFDENAIIFHDPDHSNEENRFLLLGTSSLLRVLVVCHCFRDNDRQIRIITARKANQNEQRSFYEA
jgi:uncharacterized DUF497 family protein